MYNDEKEQSRKSTIKEKKLCVITLIMKKKIIQKQRTTKGRTEKVKGDNLDNDEQEQLTKYEKKGKKGMRDNLGNEKKRTFKKEDKKKEKGGV